MKQFIIFGLILLAPYTHTHAQDFKHILQSIEQHSLQLKAAHEEAEAEKSEAKADNTLESPEFGINYLWGNDDNGTRIDLSVSQSFAFPTVYVHKHKLSKLRQQNAQLRFLNERQNILLYAKQLCIEVVYYNALIDHLNRDVNHFKETTAKVKKLYEEGEATILEYNRMNQSCIAFENELRQAITNRNNLMAELKRLNGGNDVTLADHSYVHTPLPIDFESWLATNMEQHLSVQMAQSEVGVNHKALRVVQHEWIPSIQVGYMSEKEKVDGYQGLTLGFSMPIWSGFHNVRAAKKRLSAAQIRQTSIREEVATSLRMLFSEATELQRNMNNLSEGFKQYDILGPLKKSFEAGAINAIDYFQETLWGHEMYKNMLESERDFELKVAQLKATEL